MGRFDKKTVIFLVFFTATFILRQLTVFSFSLIFLKNSLGDLLAWFLGAFLGSQFLKIDHLIYSYLTYPMAPLAINIRTVIQQRKISEFWLLLNKEVDKQKSVFYSAIFQAAWAAVALFALTSTAGVFGKAFVMAIGLHLLIEEWLDLSQGRDLGWLFWQVKRQVTPQEQKLFVWFMTGAFGILTLLLI
jgi:hypothetical protein